MMSDLETQLKPKRKQYLHSSITAERWIRRHLEEPLDYFAVFVEFCLSLQTLFATNCATFAWKSQNVPIFLEKSIFRVSPPTVFLVYIGKGK